MDSFEPSDFRAPNEQVPTTVQIADDTDFILQLPPKLISIAQVWSKLPPHVQDTMVLLAELKADGMTTHTLPGNQHLQRSILRALRHAPQDFGLTMDADGWVPRSQVESLIHRGYLDDPDQFQLLLMQLGDRIQVKGEFVRAAYGHSCDEYQPTQNSIPDKPLFHGTTDERWPMIEMFGLVPGRRKFVQLTSDFDYANNIAHLQLGEPIVLQVTTQAAIQAGIKFYPTGTHVWLAERLPAEFLQFWKSSLSKSGCDSKFALDQDEQSTNSHRAR
jgi:putative RNA 2'-phosphotransferase